MNPTMQSMMCADEVDSLDPGLFHMPILESNTYRIEHQRNPPSLAIVEAGKQLLVAAKDGDVELVRHLISKGAPFTTDWLGVSPLHLAAQNNHITTAEVLLRAGISRDARTKVERTPLHLAAQEGHAAMVNLLISQGADVNCRDMLCMTPLHWAVEKEHTDVIEALLKAGAEPYAMSKFGKTPMSIARDLGRTDFVHILETTESNPVVTLQQTEDMHQSTLEATEAITADLNMSEDITRQLAAGPKRQRVRFQVQSKPSSPARPAPTAAAAAEMEALNSQTSRPSVTVNEANNTMQLLQAHGITMLPTDKSTIVESAMESGQTVVLTEAGKMALNLTGMGGRIIGTKRTGAAIRTTKAVTSPSAAALSGTLAGGVQRRTQTVLGNASRIIKIHPSQLVALGGGRVSVQVPSFKVDQLLMQQGKVPSIVKRVVPAGKLQRVILASHQQQQTLQVRRQQSQEKESADEELESKVEVVQKEVSSADSADSSVKTESSQSADFARIERELAEARKQAAEYKERMEKKEREAELYLQQLRSLKSTAK